jgi:hypothetical protein
VFLAGALALLVVVGRLVTGDFQFILSQFWFASGIFLLLLLSVIDQPHFSTEANVFTNGIAGFASLLLVEGNGRDAIWWLFFAWTVYLMASSYLLMWIRTRPLRLEAAHWQFISRVNREIGRPEALFSAFFLWGAAAQFGSNQEAMSALFLYWAIFMVLNLPAVGRSIESALTSIRSKPQSPIGELRRITDPLVAEADVLPDAKYPLVGQIAEIRPSASGLAAAAGLVIDDRVMSGARSIRIAVQETTELWPQVSKNDSRPPLVYLSAASTDGLDLAISTVDAGSEIGRLVFYVHPTISLLAGDIVWTRRVGGTQAFYQVISASVVERAASQENSLYSVRVSAGELGRWNEIAARFESLNWVAPAGALVFQTAAAMAEDAIVPAGSMAVGNIPNSSFPAHVTIEDVITHNTAIIGVTGSGKSYLAFHLIESIATANIKVLILDVSRQHDIVLRDLNPTPIRSADDLEAWFDDPDSVVGIHQFATSTSYPRTTGEYVNKCLQLVERTPLRRGVNSPARLCIVLEEAHTLVPEWNQVAQESDKAAVNLTSRALLQGRKYGMGTLLITQRTANVTKTILNQCNTIFALQSFDQTGLDFLRNYMGEDYAQAISTLPRFHAILVGMASSSTRPLLISLPDLSDRWPEAAAEAPTDAA